jgi:predicted metal-dependent phosphoesterase TrpH
MLEILYKRTPMLKADLHLHSNEDAKDMITYSARELIEAAARQSFDVIAITNHEMFVYDEALANFAKEKGMLLVPGVEAAIGGRHVVILNCGGEAAEIKTFESLREYRKSRPDIYVFAPHPYYPNLKGHSLQKDLLRNIDLFDGVEYCHYYTRFFDYFNEMARKAASKHGKSMIGTSDSHHLFQLGQTYSMIECDKSVPSVIDALKNNRIKIVSQPVSLYNFFKTVIFIVCTYLRTLRAESQP